jgi:hypothetical protein
MAVVHGTTCFCNDPKTGNVTSHVKNLPASVRGARRCFVPAMRHLYCPCSRVQRRQAAVSKAKALAKQQSIMPVTVLHEGGVVYSAFHQFQAAIALGSASQIEFKREALWDTVWNATRYM